MIRRGQQEGRRRATRVTEEANETPSTSTLNLFIAQHEKISLNIPGHSLPVNPAQCRSGIQESLLTLRMSLRAKCQHVIKPSITHIRLRLESQRCKRGEAPWLRPLSTLDMYFTMACFYYPAATRLRQAWPLPGILVPGPFTMDHHLSRGPYAFGRAEGLI
jgi:hypothetical protein